MRLRANGLYSYHLSDPAAFHQKIAATQALFTVDELEPHLRNTIIGEVSDFWGSDLTLHLHHPMFVYEFGKVLVQIAEKERTSASPCPTSRGEYCFPDMPHACPVSHCYR